MKILGWTMAAGLMLAAAGESKAQLMIGNPLTGQGVMIGGGGVSVNTGIGYPSYGGYNAYGFNPYGYDTYGAPGASVYSSGYVAPGLTTPYGLGVGGYQSYSSTSYLSPSYGIRSYGYGYPRYYRRGLFGRRYGW